MLVSLGQNVAIGAGASQTFQYSPQSFQKLFVRLEDATGSNAFATTVTVQLGSRTILNGASAYGCMGWTSMNCGVAQGPADTYIELDFGSHQMLGNDALYVTLYNVSAVDAVDVSALVDEPGTNFPVKYTEYSDTTFSANNVLKAISWDSAGAVVDEDAVNIEVRTNIYSSAPSLISASSYYHSEVISLNYADYFGLLCQHKVPLHTTFNYASSAITDRIMTAEAMPTSRQAQSRARASGRLAQSQIGVQ